MACWTMLAPTISLAIPIIVPLIQTVNTVLYPSELITQEKKLLASYKHLPEKGAGTDDADAQAESL